MKDRAARPADIPLFAAAAAAFVGAALFLLQGTKAFPTLAWIAKFSPYDYLRDGLIRFLADLRLPVPPVLAVIDVLTQRWLGSTWLIEVVLYRASIVLAFVLALALIWPSRTRLALFLPLATMFVWAGALLNPFTPMVYDAVFPCLVMIYLALHRAMGEWMPGRPTVALPLAAGLALSLLELTRPFVLFLMPIFLASAWAALKPRGARAFVVFLVPVLLLSGTWHAHQYLAYGQIGWGNNAGYNLIRAWRQVPFPPLIDESVNLAPGDLKPNGNTEIHTENSRRLQRAVLRYAADNPWEAAGHVVQRVATFVGIGHFLEGVAPDHPALQFYDIAVRYLDLWLLGGTIAVGGALLLRPRRWRVICAAPENLAMVVGAATLVIMALGEAGEEARFQLSLLPLLAALPVPALGAAPGGVRRSARRPMPYGRVVTVATAMAVLVVVEVLVWGARRQPADAAAGGAVAPPHPAPATGRLRVAQASLRSTGAAQELRQFAALRRCLGGSALVGATEVRAAGPFGREKNRAAALAETMDMAALFAPTERRWWHEHFGNALLTALPVERWRREPLRRRAGYSYRGTLTAEFRFAGRAVTVVVAQLDVYDRLAQTAELVARFWRIEGPAILLADFGHVDPPPPALAALLAEPGVVAVGNDPTPDAPLLGRWIVARGFRLVGKTLCATGLSLHPELVADLAFAD